MNKRQVEKRRKLVRERVKYLQDYVNTYSDQGGYEDYSDKTYIDDMLYGLGLSMVAPADYSGPGGYERFKQYLREHLK
jgi:hypothetical protein